VYLPVTYQGGTSSKAKTLGLQHLQPPDMRTGSGPLCGARIIHHAADELLIKQDSVPDGEITLCIQEVTQNTQPLSSPFPDLIDVRRPGGSCI
jgi:hypothetical protein